MMIMMIIIIIIIKKEKKNSLIYFDAIYKMSDQNLNKTTILALREAYLIRVSIYIYIYNFVCVCGWVLSF